jgi:hypothetical protein
VRGLLQGPGPSHGVAGGLLPQMVSG